MIGTPLRTDERYKLYYLFWAKLIFTELIPYGTILVFNIFIVVKIVHSSRFRRRILKNMSQEKAAVPGGEGIPNGRDNNACHGSPSSGNGGNVVANAKAAAVGGGECEKFDQDKLKRLEIQRQEHKLGGILIAISLLFIFCQGFKVENP